MLHPTMIEEIREQPEDGMALYHFGLGLWMRNNWALWKGGRLSAWFNVRGICHPDDMSGIILDSFWRRLNDRPVKLAEQIERYREFWRNAGVDPCERR